MSREGEGDDSVKFTIDFDVNDSGVGTSPSPDLEKLVKKLVKEELKKGRGSKAQKRGGRFKATGEVPDMVAPAYERQHQLDMLRRRPDSSAKQIKQSWTGAKARSRGSPMHITAKRIRRVQEKLANQLFQEKLAQSGIADKNFVKFMQNFAPGGPEGSSQTVQAKMIAQHHKAVAQQAKNANRAVNQFFGSIDKQQRAITKTRRKSGAYRMPAGARGFFDKFTESQNRFESMTRKVRTCLLYTSPSPRD